MPVVPKRAVVLLGPSPREELWQRSYSSCELLSLWGFRGQRLWVTLGWSLLLWQPGPSDKGGPFWVSWG